MKEVENTMQLSADSFVCVMREEQEHWMHLHLKAVGRKKTAPNSNGVSMDTHCG